MVSSKQLGERLARARQQTNQTQEQLASRLGITYTVLVAMEKGEHHPSSAELLKLAKQLNLSLNELLSEHTVFAEPDRLSRNDEQLALSAYGQERLSEGELARALRCDRLTARDLFLALKAENDAEGVLPIGEDILRTRITK